MDFLAQVLVGQVVADERGADGAAEFLDGGVGGVFGAAAGEPGQDVFGLGGAQLQGARVFDTY